MEFNTRQLTKSDLSSASKLDHKWFGEYGISEAQLLEYINLHPTESITLLADNNFSGFTTFEKLNEGNLPSDYVREIPKVRKALFIQQFTTTTHYSKKDMSMDIELLKAVEQKANELNCDEIWEALATTHPYSLGVNKEHDAFGFYLSNNFSFDNQNTISWSPDPNVSIPCYLFRKKL